MPFDPTSTSPLNVVRQMIGDTSSSPMLTDEFIQFTLDRQVTNDPLGIADNIQAACDCLEVIAAAYSQLADKTIGDISITYRQQYTQIMQLLTQYKQDQTENAERMARRAPGTIYSGTVDMDNQATPFGQDAAGNPSGILLRNRYPLTIPPL